MMLEQYIASGLCGLGNGLAAAALAYALLRLAARHPRRRWLSASAQPPVTVLKPLCGVERYQYENLRSFFVQDYPVFQLVFGVRSAEDPALKTVARLRSEFPQVDVTVVVEPRLHGANPKVSNLINMMPAAQHELLVLADADIHAPMGYLAQLASELAPADVGVVTCLYRGEPSEARPNLWSRLGTLFIDDWFAPSVRVAHRLGSRGFSFGATIALRRATLDRIGGFQVLADQLADDWWLGELARRQGLRTVLSACVVGTLVDEPTADALLSHERRWMRTIRVVQPLGYATMFPSFTLPTAVLGAWIGGPFAHWALLLSLLLRITAFVQDRRHGAGFQWRELALLPLRDGLMLWVWLRGFANGNLRWRDRELAVDDKGLVRGAAGGS